MNDPNKTNIAIDTRLLRAVEQITAPGQSVTRFIETSVAEAVRKQFLMRGLVSGRRARLSGRYVSVEEVLDRLTEILNDRTEGER